MIKIQATIDERALEARVNATVDKLVKSRLKTIVDEKLGDFVTGHMAKLALSGRRPTAMTTLIDKRLKAAENRVQKQLLKELYHRYNYYTNAVLTNLLRDAAEKKAQVLAAKALAPPKPAAKKVAKKAAKKAVKRKPKP